MTQCCNPDIRAESKMPGPELAYSIAIAMQWRLRFFRRLLYLPKTWQPIPPSEALLWRQRVEF